jgi:peptidoglycan/xylan/chitin deacetylase (PgdA/CDA1 family)
LNPLVVYYHLVSDADVPHVSNLYVFRTASQFERDMDVLAKMFRPISLRDFLLNLNGHRPLQPDSFLLTFDDGLRECRDVVAPILSKKGIPATFFLCSDFVDNKDLAYDFKKSLLIEFLAQGKVTVAARSQMEQLLKAVGIAGPDLVRSLLQVDYRRRSVLDDVAAVLGYNFAAYLKSSRPYLGSEQVRELLRMGHAMGAHSIDHPRYADLPLSEQVNQTRQSMSFVKERFGLNYGAFAFPHSDADVSKDFFRDVLGGAGGVDICFGNRGLMRDCVSRCVQRLSMEKTRLPAEVILAKGYMKAVAKVLTGRSVVKRGDIKHLQN